MKDNMVARVSEYKKKRSRRKMWYRIVTCMAAIVVFVTTYALILPVITLNKNVCGLTEHTHTDECYNEANELLCELTEHIHTDECKGAELTDGEMQQVDTVIQKIDALPSADVIENTLLGYDESGDMDSYETYFAEVQPDILEVYREYDTLSVEQKAYVENASKLMELEWIWSVAVYDSGDSSTIGDVLDGDYAYLYDVRLKENASENRYPSTGTAPFDADDAAGNDTGADNLIVRTYDTVSYTVEFYTALRKEVVDDHISGYKTGRIYFEFILPLSEEEAQFEVESMLWLKSSQNIKYELVTVDGKQVLRGSYMLVGNATNPAAIGASQNETVVVVRALRMHNGEKIKPDITLWLEYNEVGTTYVNNIPQTIVTGSGAVCSKTDSDSTAHGAEYKTVEIPEVTVSAAPMYNITVVQGDTSRNTLVGAFDFSKGNSQAVNKSADYGIIYGRMSGYGLRIEICGKKGQGLRGVELPDENTPITFDIGIYSTYKYYDEEQGKNITLEKDGIADYQPLIWMVTDNDSTSGAQGRAPATYNAYITSVPLNRKTSLPVDWSYNRCYTGGTWTPADKQGEIDTVSVTVSGFKLGGYEELGGGLHFPYLDAADAKTSGARYYNPNNISHYWEIEQGIFSAGELWIMQPYNSIEDGTYISEKIGYEGQYSTYITLSNLNMKSEGGTVVTTEDQTNTTDDTKMFSRYMVSKGHIKAWVVYLKYNTRVWNQTLTDGAYQTNADSDWAVAGQGVTVNTVIEHMDNEGVYLGIAYDVLLKWDDDYFEPDGDTSDDYSITGYTRSGQTTKLLWAAKPDGTGWSDVDNDEEMKRYTVDDLVFYSSLSDLKASGAVCVGALAEYRGIQHTGLRNIHVYIDGKIKQDCPVNQVYMLVANRYAWRKTDVAKDVAAYYGIDENSLHTITEEQYSYYAHNVFPTRDPGKASQSNYLGTKKMLDETHTIIVNYPETYWRQDYYKTNAGSTTSYSEDNKMSALASKAVYNETGYHTGYGSFWYQDSCLIIPYESTVNKSVAQTEGSGELKTVYDMNQNQRVIDYAIFARIDRKLGEGVSSAGILETVIYIEDTIPAGMTYIPGSAYLGGTYAQDPLHQQQGTVTNGLQESETMQSAAAYFVRETLTVYSDGTTTVRWRFPVTADSSMAIWSDTLRYSCYIGTPGNEETDVVHDQQLTNSVKIWSAGEAKRTFKVDFGNLDSYGIKIQKMGAVSLSKLSDQLVVDKGADMGFTMNVGNNGSTAQTGTIIVETLPYNGYNGTSFNGKLVITEFSAGTVDNSTASDALLSGFNFYYTTDPSYAGKVSDQLVGEDFTNTSIWTPLVKSSSANNVDGRPFGLFTDSSGNSFPSAVDQTNQIVLIAAVGNLPAEKTLKMHITLSLPNGVAENKLVNFLSQGTLRSQAQSQIVNRNIEGLTWIDDNANGARAENEVLISGVTVTLKKYNVLKSAYENVCYPGTTEPIVIKTGQRVSVQSGGSYYIETYEAGKYLFTDLSAGTYSVVFSDGTGEGIISPYLASPQNYVGDDTIDSDARAVYVDSKHSAISYTVIEGIEMKPAGQLTYGSDFSRNNDSGFYLRGPLLPTTGGTGHETYILGGGLLMVTAVLCLLYKKRRKEDT
ncbi:MAG: LPXTG cell wall anchor domain-containing protein [Clostridia bacterium]|nr:LPXTG cell wall anchor domain-containing protein [Clostridia bacterium]